MDKDTQKSKRVKPVRLDPNEPFLNFFPGVAGQMSFRPTSENVDTRVYSPARDIAYLGDYLLMVTLERLAKDKSVHNLATMLGVTETKIVDAMGRYFQFVDSGTLDNASELRTYADHVKATGIEEIDPVVKAYIGSVLGELVILAAWQGKRALSSYDHDGKKVTSAPDSHELAALLRWFQERLCRSLPWKERLKAIWRLIWKGK